MGDRERTAITIRFDEDLFEEADNYRVSQGMQKAEFFENAVREYIDADRTSRIESRTVEMDRKLDAILESIGEEVPTPSEPEPVKEKDSPVEVPTPDEVKTEDGEWDGFSDEYLSQGPLPIRGRQREGKADRMFNYLMLKDISTIGDNEINDAIATIVGEADNYYRGVYVSRVEERIGSHGWEKNPLNGVWYQDANSIQSAAERHWEDIATVLFDDGDPSKLFTLEQLEGYVENRSDYHKLFTDAEVAEREVVVQGLDMIEQEYARRTAKRRI